MGRPSGRQRPRGAAKFTVHSLDGIETRFFLLKMFNLSTKITRNPTHSCHVLKVHYFCFGLGSSVGIATGYGLEGPGIESRWGRDFQPPQTGPGAHPASFTMGSGFFPWGKVRPGRAADHSHPSSAAVI